MVQVQTELWIRLPPATDGGGLEPANEQELKPKALTNRTGSGPFSPTLSQLQENHHRKTPPALARHIRSDRRLHPPQTPPTPVRRRPIDAPSFVRPRPGGHGLDLAMLLGVLLRHVLQLHLDPTSNERPDRNRRTKDLSSLAMKHYRSLPRTSVT